jgi:hypothetical protein
MTKEEIIKKWEQDLVVHSKQILDPNLDSYFKSNLQFRITAINDVLDDIRQLDEIDSNI